MIRQKLKAEGLPLKWSLYWSNEYVYMVHQEIPVYKSPNLHDEVLIGVYFTQWCLVSKRIQYRFLNDHFLQQS